jgi:hypothetical protein
VPDDPQTFPRGQCRPVRGGLGTFWPFVLLSRPLAQTRRRKGGAPSRAHARCVCVTCVDVRTKDKRDVLELNFLRDPWPKGQKDKSYFLGVSEYLLSLLSNSPKDGEKTKVPDFCPNWVWPEVLSARDKRLGTVPGRVEVKSAFVHDGPGTPAIGTKGQVFCAGQNLTSPPTQDWNCGSRCFRPAKCVHPHLSRFSSSRAEAAGIFGSAAAFATRVFCVAWLSSGGPWPPESGDDFLRKQTGRNAR